MLEFPPFRLDLRAGRLWRGDEVVSVRPKAWSLLRYLAERPGVLVTKEELHTAVWGDSIVSDDTLTRTMGELRQALSDSARTPRIIETAHRRGFRFIAPLRGSPGVEEPAEAPVEPEAVLGPGRAILVGREAELGLLGRLFRQAVTGQRQIVFVQGEPGIGKSALIDAFIKQVRGQQVGGSATPALVGYGQSVEQQGEREAYMTVLEILERLCRSRAGAEVLATLRSIAPSWLAQVSSLQDPGDGERLERWHELATPQRMLREFAGLMEALSAKHPLVLVLEDLHWSDRGTLDLVSVLGQRPDRARLMLIGTYRPAEAAALDLPVQQVRTTLRTRRRCTEIALEYLGRSHVASYLSERLGGARVAEDVAAVVHRRSDGNPLFMTVLVDQLIARGWLAEQDGGWRLTAPRSTIEGEVPDDLRDLLEGLFLRARPEEQEVLAAASVAGVVFDSPAVAAALDDMPGQVESICHHLCRAQGWLEDQGSRDWPDGTLAARYRFRHSLYQRVLYDRLSPSRRAALHERIGLRLEAAFRGRTAEISAELARHFQGGRGGRRAVVYLEQAAGRDYDRRAYRDVMACLEPALRLLDAQPDTVERWRDELRLRRLHATVVSQTAGYTADVLRESLERIQDLGRWLEDIPAQFDALSELCLLHANVGDLIQAESFGEQAGKMAERLDESATLQAFFLRGAVALWRGRLNVAEVLLGRALSSPDDLEEADRPYGVNPVVAARSFEGLRRWAIGDPMGARAIQEEALSLAERHGRPFTLAQAQTFRATVLALEESWAEAGSLAAGALEIAGDYGFPLWRGAALVIRGRVRVEVEGGPGGLAEISEGLDVLRANGLRLGLPVRLALLAGACLRVGELERGLAAVDAALTQCHETDARFFEAENWRLRGELILAQGRAGRSSRPATMKRADECFDRARAVARAQGARMLEQRVGTRGPHSGAPRRARRIG
jgi:DNA-binding winged helix-turn-helix (wHTH) protein/tetratricopeptide (TPR) repeat protein